MTGGVEHVSTGDPAAEPVGPTEVLGASDLRVSSSGGSITIVDDVSFSLQAGEKLALVGESGSGKTTVAMALLGFARPGTAISGGQVRIAGTDMLALDSRGQRQRRGRDITYVPQDPSTGLNPGMRIGRALSEMLDIHGSGTGSRRDRISQALRDAQLPDDDNTFRSRYPHQLSGGQQQRVAIALALICHPRVVVMDEPTTGLDVTTQSRLLDVVREFVQTSAVALVYVTHDLGVVRNLVDRVAVMYGGRIVETAPVEAIFTAPRHPYTRRLLEAVPRVVSTAFHPRGIPGSAVEPWNWPRGCPFAPRCDYRTDECEIAMPPVAEAEPGHTVRCVNWRALTAAPVGLTARRNAADTKRPEALLEVNGLVAGYGSRRTLRPGDAEPAAAVNGVSFVVPRGACLAVVGESGSGKTTTLRCIAGLHAPSSGTIVFDSAELATRARARDPSLRRRIQLIPQNPDSSLNPRRTIQEVIGRPLRQFFGVRGREQRAQVAALLERVRLPPGMAVRLPRELSGGERQRVAIARALAAKPDLLLCDEIVAALDVAVQAGILDLIAELRATLGTTIVFASHDLAVVRSISTATLVMKAGVVREAGPTELIFESPADGYTKELLTAVADLQPTDYPGLTAQSRP